MKRTIFIIAAFAVILAVASCSAKKPGPTTPEEFLQTVTAVATSGITTGVTPGATPTATAVLFNTGRIQSTTKDYYMMMPLTVTSGNVYLYDTLGRIGRIDTSTLGTAQGSTVYEYNAAGKVKFIDNYGNTSTSDFHYTYDLSGKMTSQTLVDGGNLTRAAQTYTYSGGLISRIDESRQGTPASISYITRDAQGYITRQDVYDAAGTTTNQYITYTRNTALKTITVNYYMLGQLVSSIKASYDSSGFIVYLKREMMMAGIMYMSYTYNFLLQAGPFDAAGMNGYYFTDKDLYGLVWSFHTQYSADFF